MVGYNLENDQMSKRENYYEYPNGEVHRLTFEPGPNSDAKLLTKAEGKRRRQAYVCKELRKLVRPGDTVYCILRHVSGSGMSRRISFAVAKKDRGPNAYKEGRPYIRDISNLVADAIDSRQHDRDGSLIVGGCGMDMGFHVVYSLGCALWPNGTPKPHGKRNGEADSAGGYALKSEWL